MERIGLHAVDGIKFPNLALMKLSSYLRSAFPKAQVELYNPSASYDLIYSSKVFTFSPDPVYPSRTPLVRGGTGYSITKELPTTIEGILPDLSLYNCEHGYGFLSRGCVRSCYFCVVPKKEGAIRPDSEIEDILQGRRSAILMDNNAVASDWALTQIEKAVELKVKIDFNQGLDARILSKDKSICKLLSRVKWLKPVRLAFDSSESTDDIVGAIFNLREAGVKPSRYSCYVLCRDIPDAMYRVELLRVLGVDPFAQPYRELDNPDYLPPIELRRFARWVNFKPAFNTIPWAEYIYK